MAMARRARALWRGRGRREPLSENRALAKIKKLTQLDVFDWLHQPEQYRLLTRLKGKPAVAVGQHPFWQISHPIIVDELKAKAEASNG